MCVCHVAVVYRACNGLLAEAEWQGIRERSTGKTRELCPSKDSHMVMVRALGGGPSLLCAFEGDGICVALPREGRWLGFVLSACHDRWMENIIG